MSVEQVGAFDQSSVVAEENVRVQCSNSSDFVVGKQTNFNGPVTIINCPVPAAQDTENIVIRDQIWTDKTLKTVQSKAADVSIENGSKLTTKNTAATNKTATYSTLPIIKDLIAIKFLGLPLIFWIAGSMAVAAIITAIAVSLTAIVETSTTVVSSDSERQFVGDESHLFFSKQQWHGLNASSKLAIVEPVPFVVISHTAGPYCYDTATCQQIVRETQKDHLSRSPPLADIAFSFMVGGDGYIYEGRGWGIRSSIGGFVGNRNIDVNLIGDFSVYEVPTPSQMDAVIELLKRGVADCHLAKNYILVAHNQTTQTLSPGRNVYSIISQWEHFQENPPKNLTRLHHAGLDSSCKPTMSPYLEGKH